MGTKKTAKKQQNTGAGAAGHAVPDTDAHEVIASARTHEQIPVLEIHVNLFYGDIQWYFLKEDL